MQRAKQGSLYNQDAEGKKSSSNLTGKIVENSPKLNTDKGIFRIKSKLNGLWRAGETGSYRVQLKLHRDSKATELLH